MYDLLGTWQQIGVFDVILPFLLVFSLTFAVLDKTKILGEGKKNLNVIVSIILALLFLQNQYLVFLLQRFLPNVSIILIIFLMFLLLYGIFLGEYKGWGGKALNLAFFVSLVAIFIAVSTDFFPSFGGPGGIFQWYYDIDPYTRGIIWFVVLVAIAIAFVSGDDKKDRGVWKVYQHTANHNEAGAVF